MPKSKPNRRLCSPLHSAPLNMLAGATACAGLLGIAFAASAVATAHSGDHRTVLAANEPTKLYTEAQAEQGMQVYSKNCASCHGDQEQGAAAPSIAGTAFLRKAKLLGWTVDNVRHLVVTTMPRSNPGSLSPQQYADVLAYLLASDCFPAGNREFPVKTTPELKTTPMQPPGSAAPDHPKLGTCSLKS
jgi:mono/diheme cytochrome c family protein